MAVPQSWQLTTMHYSNLVIIERPSFGETVESAVKDAMGESGKSGLLAHWTRSAASGEWLRRDVVPVTELAWETEPTYYARKEARR
jgi:hypothetical protein